MFNLADLYALSQRDLQLDPLALVRRLNSQTAANTLLEFTFTVPADRVFWLQHYTARARAGAAQSLTSLQLQFKDLAGNTLIFAEVLEDVANPLYAFLGQNIGAHGNAYGAASQPSNYLLMPTERLVISAGFDAAAAANELRTNLQGILLPRGNFSFA